ncbi:MAG: DUF4376 domain-containing protein [Salinisphaeraceae bacterium]
MRVNNLGFIDPNGSIPVPAGPGDLAFPRWRGKEWISDQAGWEANRLREMKETLKAGNHHKRIALTQSGVSYDFPDGSAVTAQTRNDTDRANIHATVTNGLVLQAQGVTDPVMPFRDAENVTHMMTPEQAIAFGQTVLAAVTGLYQTKWAVEVAIDALETSAEAAAFDLEAAWAGA